MNSVRFDVFSAQSPGRSKSPSTRKSSKLVDSLNLLERRAFDFSNAVSANISATSQKTPTLEHIDTSLASSEAGKTLLKRCENYCRHIVAQPNKSQKQQKEEIDKTKGKLEKAVEELDAFKEAEYSRLDRSLAASQEEFTRRVKDLERAVVKQIDAFKVELIEEMRRKERETESKVLNKAEELAQNIAPASKTVLAERSVSKSPGRSILRTSTLEDSPVKRSNERSQTSFSSFFTPERVRPAPQFSYSLTSNSDKKANARLTLLRLEESRKKVMSIGRVSLTDPRYNGALTADNL